MAVWLDELSKKIPRGGSELFTTWQGLIITAIRTHRHWHQRDSGLAIEFLGLGGVREAGESYLDCVLREVREEAGVDAELVSADCGYYFTVDQKGSAAEFEDHPRPYIIYESRFGSMPTLGAVYQGTLLDEPRPMSEVPALLLLSEDQLLASLSGRLTFAQVLSEGGQLIEQEPIPREAFLQPAGAPLRHALLKRQGLIES